MNIKSALEYIENIPFEEWLAFLEAKIATDIDFSRKLLNEKVKMQLYVLGL